MQNRSVVVIGGRRRVIFRDSAGRFMAAGKSSSSTPKPKTSAPAKKAPAKKVPAKKAPAKKPATSSK